MTVMTRELRVQVGTQTDFTTGATPTVVLKGIEELSFDPGMETEVLEDMTMGLAGGNDSVINGFAPTASFSGWATYEQLPYWFDNLFGEATPAGEGPYTRNYAAPVTVLPDPRILSIVYGAGSAAYQFIGALLSNFTLTFEQRSVARISGDLIGASIATDALESLAVPTVTPIHATHLSGFKMDAWGGTMGSTAFPNCDIRSAEFTFEPDRTSDNCFGALAAGTYTEQAWTGSLTMGLLWKGVTKTAVDSYMTGTKVERQIEMTATSGSQSVKLQFAGVMDESPTVFDDDDGRVMTTFTLRRQYHPTFANWFKAVITNGIEALD